MALGNVIDGALLQVKGSPYTLSQLSGRSPGDRPVSDWDGASYLTIFLSPDGYHHLHWPCDGELVSARWLPGVHLPQNEDAVHHIEAIYGRNERAVLHLREEGGDDVLLVLVAASLVGGIHLQGIAQPEWMRPDPTTPAIVVQKGRKLGHFAFGSTVVIVRRQPTRWQVQEGELVQVNRTLSSSTPGGPSDPAHRAGSSPP